MNSQKVHKRIIRGTLLFLLSIVALLNITVYAVDDNPGLAGEVKEVVTGAECESKKDKDQTYCKSSDGNRPGSQEVVERYGLELKYQGNGKYVLSMKNADTRKNEADVKFYIVKINGSTTNDVITKKEAVSWTKSLTIDASGEKKYTDPVTGLDGLSIQIVSSCNIKNYSKDTGKNKSCVWAYVEAEMFQSEIEPGISSIVTDLPANPNIGEFVTYTINCGSLNNGDLGTVSVSGTVNQIKEGSFEHKYCIAKKAAIAAGNTFYGEEGAKFSSEESKSFVCDADTRNDDTVPINIDTKTESYFTNIKYLYGETTFKKTKNLVFHFAPGADPYKGLSISCDMTCSEAVDVEYGPPVASSAGMCFEYKVRVTSRVSCEMKEKPSDANLCKNGLFTPTPQCVHSGGAIYTQAGPNDQFDGCVKACDGGIYSKSCSTKCYNKIYGSVSASAKTKGVYYDEVFGTQLAHSMGNRGTSYSCNGYYTVNTGTQSFGWKNNTSALDAGRYYCEGWQNRDYDYRSTFYADENGFFRKLFDVNSLCGADCYWDGYSNWDQTNQYLNRYIPCDLVSGGEDSKYCNKNNGLLDVMSFDCEQNQKAYEALVTECSKMATCSTTVAEFHISANYKNGDGDHTIDFPGKSQNDTITRKGDVVTNTGGILLPDFPTAGNGILGCYVNKGDSNAYRATWGFPGSWKNLKTNEVSYSDAGGKPSENKENEQNVWFKYEDSFCVPGDAKNVNVKWWNAYQHKKLKALGINPNPTDDSTWSVTDTYVDGKCKYTNTTTHNVLSTYWDGSGLYNAANKTFAGDPIVYNINAFTKNFGYMNWNIDVSCFYALNDNPMCDKEVCDDLTTEVECAPPSPPAEGAEIRSTDLADMFPDENGTTITLPNQTGRQPGFNWSKYAITDYAINNSNDSYKYTSNPVAYMAKLQKLGIGSKSGAQALYTAENLDYEFTLSPTLIRKIRKDRAGQGGANYTAFADKAFKFDSNGVSRYTSPLFRNVDGLGSRRLITDSHENKIPSESAIRCNNMINYDSDDCDPVHNTKR